MRLTRGHRVAIGLAGLVAAWVCTSAARADADIDVWYELISSSGPGAGVVSFSQGGPGQPLVITTDSLPGLYQLTIRMAADVPEEEALYAFSADLIAPSAAYVAVTSLEFIGPFQIDEPYALGTGPGTIIDDASELTFGPTPSGTMELIEFVLTVDRTTAAGGADITLFSGIGAYDWASILPPTMLRIADSDPMEGETADLVTNTPSIVIKQFVAPPPAIGACCVNGQTCLANVTEAACVQQGGMWQGANSGGCENCLALPATGACCFNGTTCTAGLTQAACVSQGGAWQGDGSAGCANCPTLPKPSTEQDQTSTPTTEDQTTAQSQDQTSDSGPAQSVDRHQLRHDLAVIFAIPFEDVHPVAILPVKFLGIFGLNASVVLGITDFYALPLRWLAFELTFSILDHALP